jgi:pilus assembly protein CpaB
VVDLLPAGDVAKAQADVDGRVAQTNIKKNEPVLLERVGDGSSRISVPDGLEAVTVSSDDVLAVGGAIRAGSLVDVYVETSASKVVLLGQKILVLETNGGASNENADKQVSWVTLAVTPESTSELLTASVKGTIHLVLPSSTAAKKGGK